VRPGASPRREFSPSCARSRSADRGILDDATSRNSAGPCLAARRGAPHVTRRPASRGSGARFCASLRRFW